MSDLGVYPNTINYLRYFVYDKKVDIICGLKAMKQSDTVNTGTFAVVLFSRFSLLPLTENHNTANMCFIVIVLQNYFNR